MTTQMRWRPLRLVSTTHTTTQSDVQQQSTSVEVATALDAVPTNRVPSTSSGLGQSCLHEESSYSPLDMVGAMPQIIINATACQTLCRSVAGCEHFSFWSGSCHLADSSAVLVKGSVGSIAGPADCDKTSASPPTSSGVPACSRRDAAYAPDMLGQFPIQVSSASACQRMCGATHGCGYFSLVVGGWCHLAPTSAKLMFGSPGSVSGPASCQEGRGGPSAVHEEGDQTGSAPVASNTCIVDLPDSKCYSAPAMGCEARQKAHCTEGSKMTFWQKGHCKCPRGHCGREEQLSSGERLWVCREVSGVTGDSRLYALESHSKPSDGSNPLSKFLVVGVVCVMMLGTRVLVVMQSPPGHDRGLHPAVMAAREMSRPSEGLRGAMQTLTGSWPGLQSAPGGFERCASDDEAMLE